MKKRHKQEREKVVEKLDAEEEKEERVITKELDSEREKLLREKRNRQATELSSRKDLTEEQIRDVSLSLSKITSFYTALWFIFCFTRNITFYKLSLGENFVDVAYKLNKD